MAVRSTNTAQDPSKQGIAKDAARQCLLAADKYLKEAKFDLARAQLDKARELDPSNVYITAFYDRIKYFEEHKKKEATKHPPVSAPIQSAPQRPEQPQPPPEGKPKPVATEKPLPPPVPKLGDTTPRVRLTDAEEDAGSIVEQRRREEAAKLAAEEQRMREAEARLAAEEQRRRELQARLAADDERRKEAELQALEEKRRRELEARAAAEERLRRDLEERVAQEERKRKELEDRVARKELEARALAEEQRRRELEARIAAEEQRRRELEARLAAEEQKRREEEAREEEERRRKELEEFAVQEERKRRELEARALAEEQRRKELEARALAEEQRMRDLETRIAAEERRRKELELKLAAEERKRRESEQRTAAEEGRLKGGEAGLLSEEEKIRAAVLQALSMKQKREEAGTEAAQASPRPMLQEQQSVAQMRQQIEELTRALEQEKKARQEIAKRNLQNAVKQLRAAMAAAWVNGAPVESAADTLHGLAISLTIPPEVEESVIREVKLEMYSRAVKEVIAKRKLLRSSSSTLEWLRKVYQVSVAEYLENESKFLLDLVADQYKGTILLVSKSIGTKEDITPKLKSSGYAVVQAATPENALEKIEKINPNLILCDTSFPDGLSGIKFLHVIRANSKFNFVPFILIGEQSEVTLLQSSELKPNEGVIKTPIEYDELTTLINEKLAYFREYVSSIT